MYQQARPLIGTRHYQFPKIEYRIPKVPDYIANWGGNTPGFNLLPDVQFFLIEKVTLAWSRYLRRNRVPRFSLSIPQQNVLIGTLGGLALLWTYYPLGFFSIMVLLGLFQEGYRRLMAVDRDHDHWQRYCLIRFYSQLAFWGMAIASLAYLRIAL